MLRQFCYQIGRLLFIGVAIFVWLCFLNQNAPAQGCVASRQSVCITASHTSGSAWMAGYSRGESWLSPRRWEIEVDYRYFHSHRHFVGDEEQKHRETEQTEVNNMVHILNVSATYEVNPRFTLSLNTPILLSRRYSERAPDIVTHAYGLGDITLADCGSPRDGRGIIITRRRRWKSHDRLQGDALPSRRDTAARRSAFQLERHVVA